MQPDKKDLELFKKWVSESSHIVFFGGAGVSTESGIPDFRSVDGLYVTHFSSEILKNFINFTGTKCLLKMQNRILHT